MRRNVSTLFCALALAALMSGCWHAVEDHCPGCAILSQRAVTPLPMPPSTRAVVVLVHGAFGFGEEWRPVVTALQHKRDVVLGAFAWSGPFTRKPSLPAEALRANLQAIIDGSPATAEVLVLAHSAGGALTAYVAQRLRVPPGKRVRIASIAGADTMRVAPFVPDEGVNTPFGFAVGGAQPESNALAPGVEYVEYATADRPRADKPSVLRGATRVYLGRHVGHNQSIAVAALPLVAGL